MEKLSNKTSLFWNLISFLIMTYQGCQRSENLRGIKGPPGWDRVNLSVKTWGSPSPRLKQLCLPVASTSVDTYEREKKYRNLDGFLSRHLKLFSVQTYIHILRHIRQVLLVCHKNKWRDLSQKFVTSLLKTMFLFIEGGQENIFIGPKNIFNQ